MWDRTGFGYVGFDKLGEHNQALRWISAQSAENRTHWQGLGVKETQDRIAIIVLRVAA
jgi:hypothetical protein